ncbi:TRAP-type mannitol/chloroaromatic compound transport system, small permease component [Limimonas halophila]|uniref:TRAP transporter small permease protein n=1 Tax=Limimonas halophila TaxID=1082479 RepID=A0A1G7UFC5_9PROT|nr:TRAP transporter small permease subunit [Limimonas halophila]SDG46184.1 TRAP-type mannitol/chloroaromatic compound transport system, small permease component [Limimonas halophila]
MFDADIEFVLPHWLYWGGLIAFPLVYMLIVRIRGAGAAGEEDVPEGHERFKDVLIPTTLFTRWVDGISDFMGRFVAYWTVIAVVVYFYEVIVRTVFNSPTNWAHESMFLMFGMQYVLAGAYAYLYDAHVRVDVFYSNAGPRGRAALDILTSAFFIAFALGFVWTAWTFFSQSMNKELFFWASGMSNEVSFTEWAIQYYPVKFTLVLGGLFLLLQGVSRLIKDILVFNGIERKAPDHG